MEAHSPCCRNSRSALGSSTRVGCANGQFLRGGFDICPRAHRACQYGVHKRTSPHRPECIHVGIGHRYCFKVLYKAIVDGPPKGTWSLEATTTSRKTRSRKLLLRYIIEQQTSHLVETPTIPPPFLDFGSSSD